MALKQCVRCEEEFEPRSIFQEECEDCEEELDNEEDDLGEDEDEEDEDED